MSDNNQLAVLLGDRSNLPAFVQSGAGTELNKEATAGTGGEGINRISLKQSRFRLIVGGEQVSVIQDPYMDVVVLRANPGVSRAYYTKKYDPNAEDQSPDCYSSNGVVPDADVAKPQCSNCAECPHSQWGSRINDLGNKVKACSEVKRLAIVPRSNVQAPMFQVNVPAASLKVFGNYVRMLNQVNPPIPYNGVITRIAFDETSDFPRLTFEPMGWLSDDQYAVVSERYDSEEAKRTATIVPAPEVGGRTMTDDAKRQAAAAQESAAAEQPAPKPEPKPEQQADPWATATAKAAAADKEPEQGAGTAGINQEAAAVGQGADAFDQAGWGTPEKTTSAAKKEPPAKAHTESTAKVVTGDSIEDVFGPGFDD